MNTLHLLTATALREAYASGELSPVEVTSAVFDRLEAVEPSINAFSLIERDTATLAAAESAARWRAGQPKGVLDGIPITLKENMATVGTPLTAGTAAWQDAPPVATDGPVADLVSSSGGVRIGKTVMPDFGMLSSGVSSLHGITRSPWNPMWTVGGSSGGAAAAAVAGLGAVHLGSDIGGSIRLPAGWLGLASLKPTYGLVPVDTPYMGRSYGPLTRTVDDTALAMAAIAHDDDRDFTQPQHPLNWLSVVGADLPDAAIAGLRVALQLDAGWGMPVDPEIRAIIESAAQLFADAGAHVETIGPLADARLFDSLDLFLRVRSLLDVERLDEDRRARVLPFILEWVEGGAGATSLDVLAAYQDIQALRAETNRATRPYDLVLSPVAPVAAFPAEWPMPTNDPARSLHHIGFTAPYNFSEQPSSTVNAGFTSDGRPVGLQLAAARFRDVELLRATRWFESARPRTAAPDWP